MEDPYVEFHKRPQVVKKKTYKPNYRCVVPQSNQVPSGCPDFFLPYKDKECDFRCPKCGTTTIMPLWS